MTAIASNTPPIWTQSGDNWILAGNDHTVAVIEPCWSDRHACLFLANSTGELVYDGMYGRRIARLRICLRLWFSQTRADGPRPVIASSVRSLTFHSDPAHAWLEVTRDDIAALHLQDEISPYSYAHEDKIYLEEDSDIQTFLTAADVAGWHIETTETVSSGLSFIRNFRRYLPLAKY